MEPDDLGLGSYYHHHHPQPQPPPPQRHPHQHPPPSAIPNGMLPNTANDPRPSQLLYPHSSAPSAVSSPLETAVRRKRGRPRKYGTPEQAAAAKRLSSSTSPSTSVPPLSPPRKKDLSLGVGGSSSSTSFKKYSHGNTGQGFTPHVISVTAGEDIGQKIMSFMQQSKQEMCVLSASGSISNASLRQPATSGGNIAYEGRFDILSLCGSFVHNEFGGSTGGLSVCLSSNDGQIIGGGIDGPLIAAGPVQVIVGTFSIDKKETISSIKGDASTSMLPSPTVGPTVPNLGFLSATDPTGRNVAGVGDERQNVDGYQFMIQNRSLPVSDWRSNTDSRNTSGYEFSGRVSHGGQQSPKSGDYDRFQD